MATLRDGRFAASLRVRTEINPAADPHSSPRSRTGPRSPRAHCAALRLRLSEAPPSGSGSGRVAVALATTVALKPRSIEARAVASTHRCVMKPTSTTFGFFSAARRLARSVEANAFGSDLCTTASSGRGRRRRGELEARRVGPERAARLALMLDVDHRNLQARARFRSLPISSSAGCTLVSGSLPSVYSRCASITTTVDSDNAGGALLAPAICNKVFGSFAMDFLLRVILVRKPMPTRVEALSGSRPINDEHRDGHPGVRCSGYGLRRTAELRMPPARLRRRKRNRAHHQDIRASRLDPRVASMVDTSVDSTKVAGRDRSA